ncbi:MAG: mechanosensitive ion channel family protein [Gammaproteobacteria bacterium]|jgi:small conductance mechanosensitive channel|nr:mechanosensitive ion channel family protein [Gammaproteobacteria bacterium]MBU1407708.1 mechanosensitive ion channel family protein [Gammaproteobacteria bacterium]MBU1531821.1 mechanosensitive ion channel family protein [Gammaproteobacteria bacterium]
MDEQLQTLEHAQRTAIDLAIQFGPKLVVALLILVTGYFVGRWVGRLADSMLVKMGLDETLRQLLVRIVRILVLGLFLIMALQNLGVQLLPLLAGLGVAGAGIALAMQGVLGNLAAGLTIIFTRPFQVGEYISIAGEEGAVEDIKLFNTVLSHPDRSRIVIPNRKIVGEILHNFGALRQLDVVVGVAYDTDIRQALAAIRELLAAHPKILQAPEPVIRVLTLADSGVNIAIRPWTAVADFNTASSDITQAVLETFRERGIQIPFPQREVRLLGDA